jgi:hypothetical protein
MAMVNLMDFDILQESDFNAMVFDSGIIVKDFDPNNWTMPSEGDVSVVTSGDITVSDGVTSVNLGEDVNNIFFNYAELQVVTGKEASTITVTALKFDTDGIRKALGAADIDQTDSRKVTTRLYYKDTDFENLTFVMHKIDGGFVAVVMNKALSTGGLSITATKGGKGRMALTFTGFRSINAKTVGEIDYYISTGTSSGIEITAQPKNVETTAGTAVEFSVTATGATGYQWQVQTPTDSVFVDIEGETTNELELAAADVTTDADGNRYRCKLTSSTGTRFTVPALLTVTES